MSYPSSSAPLISIDGDIDMMRQDSGHSSAIPIQNSLAYDLLAAASRENLFASPAVKSTAPPDVASSTPVTQYLQLQSLDIKLEVHMATAFITLEGVWKNQNRSTVDCVLEIPLNTKCTSTSCQIKIGERIFETLVISKEEADGYAAGMDPGNVTIQNTNPDYFYLPFEGVKAGEVVSISFTYFETLIFWEGSYRVLIPLKFRPETLPELALQNVVSLKAVINAGTKNSQWGSASHQLTCEEQTETRVVVRSDPATPWENRDFDISYKLWHDTILCSAINMASRPDTDEKGNFCLFMAPPHLGTYPTFGRRIIFILDKSGSMEGEVIEHARNALKYGIGNLTPRDFFTVIAFSEHQYYYSQTLVPSTEENQASAIEWVNNIQAAGLTDILTPLKSAVNILDQSHNHPQTKGTVPFVFLITDGAVKNERDICAYTHGLQSPIRFNTLGIGQHANHVFLKALAQIGRGFCEIVWKGSEVFRQIVYLLGMTNAPILTEVKVGISKSAENIEIFPYPIPDLFCGAPLLISGTYTGKFPQKMSVFGVLSNGEKFKVEVQVETNSMIPVDRIFVKQQLDLLTANAWLVDSRKIKNQVIEISCRESMPCSHTRMVAFEVPKEKQGKNWDKKNMLKDKRLRRNILLAVGGLVVIGVAAAAFGDIMGTIGNVPIGGDFGGGLGHAGGDCCGGSGGDCGHGGDCGGGDCGGSGDCGAGGGDCGGGDCGGADCHGCDCQGCECHDCGNCDCQC